MPEKLVVASANLEKTYKLGEITVRALRGVDIELRKGEFVKVNATQHVNVEVLNSLRRTEYGCGLGEMEGVDNCLFLHGCLTGIPVPIFEFGSYFFFKHNS